MVYRRATRDDAERLAAFAARTFRHTYEAHNTAEDMRDYLASAFGTERQARELGHPSTITMLAESGVDLVGYAQLRIGRAPAATPDADVEIYRFYVDASAHGTGVAQALMHATIDAARGVGASQLWLGVWERNSRAIAFYQKCGFSDVGTQIFKLGNDEQTDRVLVKPVECR
jgi:diamine N-acetyltransferase